MNLLIILTSFMALSIFSISAGNTYAQQSVTSNETVTQVGNPPEDQRPKKPGASIPAFPGMAGGGIGEFVYYCQGNTAWANSCGLGVAGCGPTSMAMVLSTFGTVMTPPQLDREWGYRACGDVGSTMEGAIKSQWLKDKGFEHGPGLLQGSHLNAELAKQFIDEKYLIIGSSAVFPCANCKTPGATVNHIFVVDGVDVNNGTVDIRDPNNCSYTDGNDENQAKRIKNIRDFPWLYAYPIRKIPA